MNEELALLHSCQHLVVGEPNGDHFHGIEAEGGLDALVLAELAIVQQNQICQHELAVDPLGACLYGKQADYLLQLQLGLVVVASGALLLQMTK